MRDLKNNLKPVQSLAPAARTASANGAGVDLRGFDAAMIVIDVGAWTDGAHQFAVEESADNATWTAVAAADLDGAAPNVAAAGDGGQIYKIGYRGAQRYLRVTSTVTGAPATGAVYGASILLGMPAQAPVA